jgi:hypothetical protein
VGGGSLPPKGKDYPAEYRALVKSAEREGYDYLLVSFPREDYLRRMEEFAREYIA